MKRLISSLVCILLVSCNRPSSPSAKNPSPSPSPEVASPSPSPVVEELPHPADFVGVWEVKDEDNDAFNIILIADGRSVANWSNGRNGARGERGQWRVSGKEILIFHRNGFTDCFVPQPDGSLLDRGYSPDSNIHDKPASESPVKKVDGDLALYSGIWRLNQEPDGNFLYLSLQSDGDAESTNTANNPGKWQLTPDGAKITWANGWTELLTREQKQPDQFLRMAWAPNVPPANPPTDTTQAFKVGMVPSRVAP